VSAAVEVRFVDAEGFGRIIRTTPSRAPFWESMGDAYARRRDAIRAAVARVSAADAEAAHAQTARNFASALQESS
jgi:hypothetical protein